MIRSVCVTMVLGLAAASCGGTESGDEATGPAATSLPPSTGAPVSEVTVTTDVEFASAAPDLARWTDMSFDVYAPAAGSGMPLVVIFPPHALSKENPASGQLAMRIAEQDAVAVVANWTELTDAPAQFSDPDVLRAVVGAGQSVAGCAVSSAVSQAAEFGADPAELVLVGEVFGANTASMVALGVPDPYPECTVADQTWAASRLVGLNGDWLVGFPLFDPVADAAIETLSPWSLLDDAPALDAVFPVTADAQARMEKCGGTEVTLAQRDVDGRMSARLDALGALEDGCLDAAEMAAATAAEMTAHGLDATTIVLPNEDGATRSGSGVHVEEFGPADLDLLVAAILGTA